MLFGYKENVMLLKLVLFYINLISTFCIIDIKKESIFNTKDELNIWIYS